jgi:hypothetical protein
VSSVGYLFLLLLPSVFAYKSTFAATKLYALLLAALAVGGVMYRVFAGMQGGVMFEERMVYPVFSVAFAMVEAARVALDILEQLAVSGSEEMPERAVVAMDRAKSVVLGESALCLVLSAFGFPSLNLST